jgi:protoporphyrinogen IX oxidase
LRAGKLRSPFLLERLVIYIWLKALHIVAVIVWIGGMLLATVTITILSEMKAETDGLGRSAVLKTVRRWDHIVTSPAMLLVWTFGLTLTYLGGWFSAPWLMIKLVVVLLLSGFHGLVSGTLQRLARTNGQVQPFILKRAPAFITVGVLVAVILVVLKPW